MRHPGRDLNRPAAVRPGRRCGLPVEGAAERGVKMFGFGEGEGQVGVRGGSAGQGQAEVYGQAVVVRATNGAARSALDGPVGRRAAGGSRCAVLWADRSVRRSSTRLLCQPGRGSRALTYLGLEKVDAHESAVVERMRSIGVAVETAVEVPRPGRATQEEANLLGISVGELLTRIERTYYDSDGRPVETADIAVPDVRWEIAYEIPID
ncbi:UTRA domain-containing protein [Streptomyces scabiei]|uniref:UTRA domain-containing protein n=2 Tax=Streptomyces TaxID=1883 RepID=UPI0027E0FAF3|nr:MULTISPECIES: UTRA domain-containing protein [Streptomyces]